ncbi:hypothetical protein KFE25_003653 [Diacronema lutheri]|uniref:ODAD1 central coiled coil region domain-containing protein n=1 Tax=Diacronema lutheri TaxID=2081491 RepID=A0A8J5XBJ3_DIALT|nr:hypothetical protein KFE25_003653 [Diacronema lutheri]
MAQPGQAPAEALASLQERFQLLEGDRKAFYEKSQIDLRENKAQQEELRNENKLLRTQLTKLQKEHSGRDGGPGSELHAHELQKLEHQHNVLRQKHNALASANRDRELLAEQQADQLRDLQRDAKRPAALETPLTRQIRILENRLDKAMIKYNEAMSIKKTYEQIVKRLKEERVNFDHQLQAIEGTLKAKSSDYNELLLMANEAAHARDLAKQDLAKTEALALEERRHREAELRSRRTLVEAQKAVMSRMDVRDQRRRSVILEAKGDLDDEQEERLREEAAATQASRAVAEGAISEESERMAAFQAAFRKIREATGVSDLSDVVHKFASQGETLATLKRSTEEAQRRLDALNDERASARVQLEELKYVGGAGGGGRQEVEALERKLAETLAAQERAKARSDRLAHALVDMRAGVEHLGAKVEAAYRGREGTNEGLVAQLQAAGAAGGVAGTAGAGVSDANLIDVLLSTEAKLVRMIDATMVGRDVAPASPNAGASRVKVEELLLINGARSGAPVAQPALASAGGARGSFGGGKASESEGDDDDDDDEDELDTHAVLDRETMKKQHGVLLDKAAAKGKRRRKPGIANRA